MPTENQFNRRNSYERSAEQAGEYRVITENTKTAQDPPTPQGEPLTLHMLKSGTSPEIQLVNVDDTH